MESTLLTSNEQLTHLEPFVKLLVEKFQPQQLICFTSITVREERNSCFINEERNSQHHCCLLLIAENAAQIHNSVQNFSNAHYKIGRIAVISHEQAVIDEAIMANSRFFISVYNRGCILYSQDGLTRSDHNIQYDPTLAAEKATGHLNHRIPLAEGFLTGAYKCFISKQYLVSVFMLHQVVEQCCMLLIRVNMGYWIEMHNLHRLLGICTSFSKQPYELFFSGSKEDIRLFEVLVKSYSKSRYSSEFQIEEKDALLLYERVSAFLTLTKEMSRNEITILEQQIKIYTQLGKTNIPNLT